MNHNQIVRIVLLFVGVLGLLSQTGSAGKNNSIDFFDCPGFFRSMISSHQPISINGPIKKMIITGRNYSDVEKGILAPLVENDARIEFATVYERKGLTNIFYLLPFYVDTLEYLPERARGHNSSTGIKAGALSDYMPDPNLYYTWRAKKGGKALYIFGHNKLYITNENLFKNSGRYNWIFEKDGNRISFSPIRDGEKFYTTTYIDGIFRESSTKEGYTYYSVKEGDGTIDAYYPDHTFNQRTGYFSRKLDRYDNVIYQKIRYMDGSGSITTVDIEYFE